MDINKASMEELQSAFQVDGVRARYLVDRREKTGPFRGWEDVKEVPGFDDKMVENLRAAGLTVGGAPATTSGKTDGTPGLDSSDRQKSRSLNVNTASAEDLENVFQLDGGRARYLIEARNRIGRFTSWEQIKEEVPSFEDGMIENLKQAGATIT
jgi:competence ComEA-like helix-hairpin-helix protein